MEKKYPSLRAMIWVYRIGAIVLFFGGIVYGGVNSSPIIIALGIFIALSLYGLGELLLVFIDIEENTRRSNLLIQKSAQTQRTVRRISETDDEPSIDAFKS